MSNSLTIMLVVALLSTVTIFGIAYAVAGPRLMSGRRSAQRVKSISQGEFKRKGNKGQGKDDSKERRRAIQETLKELEDNQKENKRKVSIGNLIDQAGFDFSVRAFWIASGICGLTFAIVLLVLGMGPIAILLGAFMGAFGLPRWTVSYFAGRRRKAFLEEFANSLDVIVRGVKSGLPLNECLKIIAREASEPVRSEFQQIVDSQQMGVPLDQSLAGFYERMPIAEVNFFQIVLVIQQSAGGNLSEALGNLTSVLRNRKIMRAKIKAMSSEAKASAGIIGSLPPAVMGLVYMTTPDYIMLLFTTQTGHIMLGLSAAWMLCGVLVMRKMINFNF